MCTDSDPFLSRIRSYLEQYFKSLLNLFCIFRADPKAFSDLCCDGWGNRPDGSVLTSSLLDY